jgi:hypothetical protein
VQSVNRDYLIASMLAQEGLELVRNIRDSNWFTSGANWDDGIRGDGTFSMAYNSVPDFSVNLINDPGANLKINNGFYEYNNGVDTKFYRLLTTTLNGDALTVNCNVEWSERGRVHNYIAETMLYNWK